MELRNLIITLALIGSFVMSCDAMTETDYANRQSVSIIVQEDFSEYMNNLQSKLAASWQPPDFMEEGHVKVYFKLNRHGILMNPTVIESSGDDIYDESAIDAVKNSAPFGEFPQKTNRENIAIKYSFDTILIEEERMKGYYELAKKHTDSNPTAALEYLNKAIREVGGEEGSYFLYKRRSDIKERLGDFSGAKKDYETYKTYVERANIKRLHLLTHLAETQKTVYIYHYLAYAYEQVGDYENAICAINKAIEVSDYTNEGNLKRYKKKLEKALENSGTKIPDKK